MNIKQAINLLSKAKFSLMTDIDDYECYAGAEDGSYIAEVGRNTGVDDFEVVIIMEPTGRIVFHPVAEELGELHYNLVPEDEG